MVDTADLKSAALFERTGSIPVRGTIIMNPFQYQIDTTPPCSGNVIFLYADTPEEVRRKTEKDYKEHVGQHRLNYIISDDLNEEITWLNIYTLLKKLWSCDVDEFMKSNTFVGYFNNNEGFPIFRPNSSVG